MKIYHITATHVNELGGVGVVLRELIQAQNRIPGVESKLISVRYPIDTEKFVSSEYVPTKSLNAYLKNGRPDIAILHSYFELEYISVARILKQNGIPYLIEPHGGFMKGTYRKSTLKKIIADKTIFRLLLKNAKGYVFLNESEKANSVHHKAIQLVIPNGITPYEKQKKPNDKSEHQSETRLYYIGRYDIHEKGIDSLLDALTILDKEDKSFVFDFYGSGSETSKQYIKNRAAQLKSIKMHEKGPMYGDEKIKTLYNYNIMVLVSRHEGYPMSVLEAWNAGIGCVLTKETNLAKAAEKHKIGWQTEDSPIAIADTIKRAIEEYEQQGKLIEERCRLYVKEECNWDQIAVRSVEAIKNLFLP